MDKQKYIVEVVSWVTCCAAIIAAIVVTGRAVPLFALLIPFCASVIRAGEKEQEKKQKEK